MSPARPRGYPAAMPDQIEAARAAVALARGVVDGAARSLATRCADGDAVSVTTLEDQQATFAYDLAHAAAAVEALACLVAIEHQQIPPTINLDHPDPDCDLCHVANTSIARAVNIAISNSFGFGGSNTTLVLQKAA